MPTSPISWKSLLCAIAFSNILNQLTKHEQEERQIKNCNSKLALKNIHPSKPKCEPKLEELKFKTAPKSTKSKCDLQNWTLSNWNSPQKTEPTKTKSDTHKYGGEGIQNRSREHLLNKIKVRATNWTGWNRNSLQKTSLKTAQAAPTNCKGMEFNCALQRASPNKPKSIHKLEAGNSKSLSKERHLIKPKCEPQIVEGWTSKIEIAP